MNLLHHSSDYLPHLVTFWKQLVLKFSIPLSCAQVFFFTFTQLYFIFILLLSVGCTATWLETDGEDIMHFL